MSRATYCPPPRELELSLLSVDRGLRDAEVLVADCSGRRGSRVRELACNLKALRSSYLETGVPRLRRALLREAMSILRDLRDLGVGSGPPVN